MSVSVYVGPYCTSYIKRELISCLITGHKIIHINIKIPFPWFNVDPKNVRVLILNESKDTAFF